VRISLIRSLDRFLGVPLCWMTGLFFRKRSQPLPPARWANILVIKFFGLGSILLTTPMLGILRKLSPRARILYLSFESNREILERLDGLDEILSIRTSTPMQFLDDALRVLRYLRKAKVDAVFDLEFFSKFSTLISAWTRASVRTGFSLPTIWRRRNLSHPIQLSHETHARILFLQHLSPFGWNGNEPPIQSLAASPGEQRSMREKLSLVEASDEVICINVNAGVTSLERRWALSQFAELITKLSSQTPQRRFVLIGTDNEREYVNQIFSFGKSIKRVATNSAGLLGLGELIALFQQTTVLITNDSGPMHIAAAVGTPVVGLFGPESPKFYGSHGDVANVYKAIACSPCLNFYNAKLFTCPFNARCMQEISTTEVLAAANSLLSSDVHASISQG